MSITKDVSVRLSLNGADDVKAQLTSVTERADKLGTKTATLSIDAHDEDFMIQAAEVLEEAKKLGATNVRIAVAADSEHAKLALDDIRAKADELGLKKVNIKVTIDQAALDASIADAETKLAGLRGAMAAGEGGGMGSALGLGAMFGIPLLPAVVAGGGGIAALAAPLAGAVLGYKNYTAAAAKAKAADKALAAEQMNVANSSGKVSKLTEAKLQADEKAASAADKHAAALKTQYSAVTTFMHGVTKAEGVFERWGASLSKPIFGALDKGLGLIKPLLADITPVVKAMTPEVGKLVGMLGQSIKSGAIKDFFDWLAQNGPSAFNALLGIGKAIGSVVVALIKGLGANNSISVFKGLTSVISGLAPVVGILARGLGDLMGFIMRNRALMIVFGVAIGALGVALGALSTPITVCIGAIIAIGAAVSLLTSHWKTISRIASEAWHDVVSVITSAFGLIASGAQRVWHDVTSWFSRIWHDIVGVFKNAGSWLLDAGKNIVEGLINGIKGMASEALHTVENLGSDLVNAAKSLFGIRSPSTVFHEIGVNIGRGLINGLTKMAPEIVKSLNSVISQARSYASSVTANALGGGLASITDPNGGLITGGDIQSGIRSQLASIRLFMSDIEKLKKAGLSGPLLRQIIAMGPVQGDQYAQAILSSHIAKSISGLYSQEQTAAGKLGTVAAGDVYGSQIKNLLDRLDKRLDGREPVRFEWVGGQGADQEFITWLKKSIRVRGGDPAVLGR